MNTIHKLRLHMQPEQDIEIPVMSRIIKFDFQNGMPTIWYVIDTESPPMKRHLCIFGTGNPFPKRWGKLIAIRKDGCFEFDSDLTLLFIDTAFISDTVWHLFWRVKDVEER